MCVLALVSVGLSPLVSGGDRAKERTTEARNTALLDWAPCGCQGSCPRLGDVAHQ